MKVGVNRATMYNSSEKHSKSTAVLKICNALFATSHPEILMGAKCTQILGML